MIGSKLKKINKFRLFTILFLVIFLLIGNIAFFTTFGDRIIDFDNDSDYIDTGIVGDTVYINRLDNDYDYYMGLNYTKSNGTYPTSVNKNIYNRNNLVALKVTYSGTDMSSNTGYVSTTERQNKYIYFRTLEVNNNNTPNDTSDDYAVLTLIDNPFTDRPTNKGFNGWYTNEENTLITFDSKYYEYSATIPVSYTNGIPDKIEIDFFARWTDAKFTNAGTSFTNALANLDTPGMHELRTVEYEYGTLIMDDYYYSELIARRSSCAGYYNNAGVLQGNNCRCNTNGGCTYYQSADGQDFDEDLNYFLLVNGTMVAQTGLQRPILSTTLFYEDINMASYYRSVTIPYGETLVGYYNNLGVYQTTGTCNTNAGCNYYELVQYYDEDSNENIYDINNTYYYLATRDTNILILNATTTNTLVNNNKPFTLTSVYNGNNYKNSARWSVGTGDNTAYADIAIENITIYSTTTRTNGEVTPGAASTWGATGDGSTIFGAWHNLKLGRGISTYGNNTVNFGGVIGGNTSSTGSANNTTKYKLVVESGIYNSFGLATGNTGGTLYINARGVYGNDYDLAAGNNSNLEVRHCASGSWNGTINGANSTDIALDLEIKSGGFGTNKYDYATGIYIGGRNGGTHNAARKITIYGGYIFNLLGGPLTNSNRYNTNDTYIYIRGGETDVVIGGAGRTETYGHRIIQMTSGKVNYSIFGGSNGIEGDNSSNNRGTLTGSTYVYVGGNSVVGDQTLVNNNTLETESQVESGSVFGVGNGRNGYQAIGSADNSTVVIDGNATVLRNVYGGGNYGAVGYSSDYNSLDTNIIINGGLIKGSVYGGGNRNGSGTTSVTVDVNIEMNNGVIVGSLFGGSNITGTTYGKVDIKVNGGEIGDSVYGGGQGGINGTNQGTFVRDSINVTIGSNQVSNTPIINNSVYGGSALGSVNGTTNTTNLSTSTCNVTVNKGIITNVFGGGEGNSTTIPYVMGNITVNINGGTIDNVFGGNDLNGKPNGSITVNINGGNIDNTYGGGNQTSANNTTVNLTGGTSTKIYGGSNLLGDVTSSTVNTTGGTSNTIYGGNNQGGTTATTNVNINGGNIEYVYGGGEQTSVVNSTNVTVRSDVGTVFGGSNLLGNIPVSNIDVYDAKTNSIYGGNNQGGKTSVTNIDYYGGYTNNLFGGGLNALTDTTNVNIHYGGINNLFGGGSEAGATTTNVNIDEANINKLFGGSNVSGDVTESYISSIERGQNYTANQKVSVSVAVSQSDQHNPNSQDYLSTEKLNVSISNLGNRTITSWDLYLITSEGYIAADWSSATIEALGNGYHINEINKYYGLNQISAGNIYSFDFHVHSQVNYEDFEILGVSFVGHDNNGGTYISDSLIKYVYGGNNLGGSTETTNIDLDRGSIDYLYGGGNRATTTDTNININNVTINKALFGGGNEAGVDTATTVISSSTVGSQNNNAYIYGGGNAANVNETSQLDINNNTTVYGNVFGGGNLGEILGVVESNISDSTVNGDIYGGGNAASVGVSNTADSAILNVSNVNATNIYGGGNAASVIGNTNTQIEESTVTGNIFGGGNGIDSVVEGDLTGESNLAKINGNAVLYIENTSSSNIYGGGNLGMVVGSTNVTSKNATTTSSIYGGGNAAIVGTNTSLYVSSGNISGSVYAGGNGATAVVYGNTHLDIDNGANIANHVFGGGNAAATGRNNTNNSTGVVNIVGANIDKNVYGGANTSVLYGVATVNIGASAVNNNNLIPTNIDIGGTVFGGGEANASGSEVYDYSFISVTTGINININGQGHNVFDIDGSIFGSGNASSTEGYSNINIKNYGTSTDIKRNISIQRADIVNLENSYLELSGATDRTNEYSSVLFTLSRIDELKMINNSSIYLRKGANLLQKVSSVAVINNTEEKGYVTIDTNTGNVVRNSNNRIYMYEGENLNIAKNQSVTEYGDVYGMFFFGMYLNDRYDNIITALYDNHDNLDSVPGGDLYYFSNGSYVLGRHLTNHNIEVDGFYSHYANEDGDKVVYNYIEPTPPDSVFYIWSIGEVVASYDVTLTASKYSTLGVQEVPLLSHATPNTVFSILGVNFSALEEGITLVDYVSIPRVAATSEEADTVFGLNMKNGVGGWLTDGSTNFISEGSNQVTGTREYVRENLNNTPSLQFYLYHSKNMSTTGNMGSVTISMVAITPIDDLNNEVERININIDLNRVLYNTNDYEGTITPGKKYEMFGTSSVDITTKSSFSTYYSLFIDSDENPYKTGYHRALVSTYAYPENTKITMIDLHDQDNPIYYYYVINSADYNDSLTEYALYGETSYKLSKFIRMGSTNSTNNYNDAVNNNIYYQNGIAEEEFIFIVDFKDTNINENVLNKSMLIELRNGGDQTLISVLGIEQSTLKYNLYTDSDAVVDLVGEVTKDPLYLTDRTTFIIDTNYVQQSTSSATIFDTTFEDEKMGLKISVYDSNDNLLSAQDLFGANFIFNDETYYPRYDGTTRIKIADRVGNARSRIIFNTGTSNLSTDTYKFVFESFGSYDGIYFGPVPSDSLNMPIDIIASPYGLEVTYEDSYVFIDKITGKNQNNSNAFIYNLRYQSELTNPNIRIKLQRRDYSSIYSLDYVDVDIKDYITNDYQITTNENEYILVNNPANTNTIFMYFKENLVSGTYRIVFSLYDNSTYIGQIYKYIIIK